MKLLISRLIRMKTFKMASGNMECALGLGHRKPALFRHALSIPGHFLLAASHEYKQDSG